MTFERSLQGRDNNLSLLRLIAALMVIFHHAYYITGAPQDILEAVSGRQASIGGLAVMTFFFYSGFLIMKSVMRRHQPGAYFKARCVRIFPPLWIVVLASVLILGPLLTTRPVSAYFLDPGTWKYLLNGILLPVHELPGVFLKSPYNPTVNGSLWTLPVEFGCYVLCYLFYRLGFAANRRRTLLSVPLVAGALILSRILLPNSFIVTSALRPVALFYLGMLCFLFRDRIPVSAAAFWVSAALLIASVPLRFFRFAVYFTLPYVLMYLAFGVKHRFGNFGGKYELSYGIYLTAWPIQQILACALPGMSQLLNFAASAPLAIAAGFLVTWLDMKINSRLTGGAH